MIERCSREEFAQRVLQFYASLCHHYGALIAEPQVGFGGGGWVCDWFGRRTFRSFLFSRCKTGVGEEKCKCIHKVREYTCISYIYIYI